MADHRVMFLTVISATMLAGLAQASLVYYPPLGPADVQNVLSPLNLCERLCGQCGCLGLFVADDVCQCSCDVRGCDPGYTNCTVGMLKVCDESQFDCELPEEQQQLSQQEYGLRTRDPRGHKCMECHDGCDHHDHDCDHGGYGEDKGCHDGCGDKKFFCCKKHKKHRKKCGKKKHGRKIHIKIKGKLPDCCYFNQHHDQGHYEDYRAPEQPRIPEEPVPEEIEAPTEAPPIYEPTPEPECDKSAPPKAKSYSEPEAPYVEPEGPRKCCQSSSDIHCDNCHIYHGGDQGHGQASYGEGPSGHSSGGGSSGYSDGASSGYSGGGGYSDYPGGGAPYAGPPIAYGPPVYIPTYSNNYRMPAEINHPPIQEEPRPAEIKKAQSSKPASFRNADYEQSYSGGDGYGASGGHVLEYSHHKVTIPSDHLKPIIEKFLDHPPPSAHPIDLTIYNQVVNQQLYDDVKASSYGTDSFQPPKQPSRDYYEPPSYENSAQTFPLNTPSYAPKNYLPVAPPSGAYIAPSYPPQPFYYSGPDSGPQVQEASAGYSTNAYEDAVGAKYRSAMAAASSEQPSQMQMNAWKAAAAASATGRSAFRMQEASSGGGAGCQQGQGRFYKK
ncbi:uncharacterized protein LOC120415742 [Culex pipiens pallens]|uniref:uncharacterized protein LOC120415742 n=1 Tax=Culex pipiens pallens TaxID=42434 RepID=UPI00195331F9|nr:uncharacterized protein LOC120415742 [Culex pipiens pallens]